MKLAPSRSFFILLFLMAAAAAVTLAGPQRKTSVRSIGRGGAKFANKATPAPITAPTPAPPPGTPRFFNYVSPQGIMDSAGEPSIGSNWNTENTAYGSGALFKNKFMSGIENPIPNGGTTLYFGGFSPTLARIIFDDCSSPARAFWQAKPLLTASTTRAAGDPILFTDHPSAAELASGSPHFGRTFVSQLEGLTPAGSTTDITDNDGDSFLPSEGSSLPSDIDHQTFGGGPFHSPLPNPNPVYPHAIYYASQSVAEARAALSVTGGFTFLPGSPMYVVAQCAGLHGHIKVAPDGTVYVPQKACGATLPFHNGDLASAIVSETNGAKWDIRPIPGAVTNADRDPSIGIATDGTVYLGYQALVDKDEPPRIAVTHDKGLIWSAPYDVGASLGIQNMAFPEVVAGDPMRAAFAFYGTTTGVNTPDNPGHLTYDNAAFPGVWYMYVATTFDGGVTWYTQNVTPGDPVQRGGICGSGTCRNLLDFFDATIDKEGRVVIGAEDGCVSASCINGGANDFTAKGFITRQTGGMRMFAAFDPAEPTFPGAPMVTAGVDSPPTKVQLSWPEPDNGGRTITGYNVYRFDGSTFVKIGTTPVPNYTDTTFNPALIQPYRVTALNDQGEGPYCTEVTPALIAVQNPCTIPGVLVVNDLNADGSDNDAAAGPGHPPDPRVNIRQLFIAEPFFGAGVNKLVFTMQLAPSTGAGATTPPPNSQWYIVWQRPLPDTNFDRWYVGMKTDAAGNLSFEYGKFGAPTPIPPDPNNPNTNTPVKIGDVDSGTYNVATGVVTIILSNSKAENVGAGGSLSKVNVRTYFARPDSGPKTQSTADDITGDGNYTLVGNAACVLPVPLIDVVSTKTHGSAGGFNIHLPLTGNPGIECRVGNGGVAGNHTIVFTFGNPLVSVGGATVTGGNGSVHDSAIGSDPHQYIVNLTGVANAQLLTVTLTGITDISGNNTASLPVTMGVLLGDVNATHLVDGNDVSLVQGHTRQPTDRTNFPYDVDISGQVDGNDVSTTQGQTRTSIP